MSARRLALLLGAAVLFGVSFALGYQPSSTPASQPVGPEEPDQVARPDAPGPSVEPALAPPPPGADGSAELDACRAAVALCEGLAAAQHDALAGPVHPWPEEPASGYAPRDVERALDDVAASCPETGAELAFVDCYEYPCLVWTPLTGAFGQERAPARPSLDRAHFDEVKATAEAWGDCAAWPYTGFGPSPGAQTQLVMGASGYYVWVLAPSADFDADMEQRVETRIEFAHATVAEEWGEPELTMPP